MSKYTSDGTERKATTSTKISTASGAGAVDEEVFRQSFIPSTSISVYSARELADHITRIKEALSGSPEEWEKRVDALKTLRSLIANGAQQFDDFTALLRTLESPVEGCLRDLRSAVVREACITVAYLSQELRNRFDHFAEAVLLTLINLVTNSAKVMASSGVVALRFVLENTYAPRLLPILTSSLSSKSNVTRRCTCELLETVFRLWPVNVLEKHLGLLQESLRRGISDADQEARTFSRRAFPVFAAKFPDQADGMLLSLDAQKRKLVEQDMISAGLSAAIGGHGGSAAAGDNPSVSSRSRSDSQNNLYTNAASNRTQTRPPTEVTRRPNKPVLGAKAAVAVANATTTRTRPPVTNNGETMPGSTTGRYVRNISATYETRGRTPGRKVVSQSQPTSREVSPSRYTYLTYGTSGDNQDNGHNFTGDVASGHAGVVSGTLERRSAGVISRIPRSQGASREVSPTRSTASGYSAANYAQANNPLSPGPTADRRAYASTVAYRARGRPSLGSMSDCGDLGNHVMQMSGRREQFESDDNNSETSSICSERSGRSVPGYRRQAMFRPTTNITEIIAQLASTQWSDKKDGLINLQNFMRSGLVLNPADIRRLTQIFTKMFGDSQGKVVSLFMDTLQLFIKEYHPMLRDWLYTLLVRLLNRQGHEVLASHQKAIQETLFVLRSHLPLTLQFNACCRFITDNTQTPNFKVKGCLLEYMKDLILMMSPEAIANPSPEIAMAVSRIINWSTEPKSADVRRMASRVIIKLFDLNSSSFSAMLQSIPRNFHDRACEILKTYQKTTTIGGGSAMLDNGTWKPTLSRSGSLRKSSLTSPGRTSMTRSIGGSGGSLPVSPTPPGMSYQQLPVGASNRQAADVNSLVRQATDGLASLNTMSTTPTTGIPLLSQHRSSAGSITSPMSISPSYSQHKTPTTNGVLRPMQTNNIVTPMSVGSNCSDITPIAMSNCYNAPNAPISGGNHANQLPMMIDNRVNKPPFKGLLSSFDQASDEMPPEDVMSEILQELSNHNERNGRHEQRKACMLKLIKLLREGTVNTWDEHFKPTLLILLETLGDDGSETRALALRVLQELVRTKSDLFHDFAHLFIIKVLEACTDKDKAVIRSAEECAQMVAQHLPQKLCLDVLTPLIYDPQLQINLPAVKMQSQVIRYCTPELVEEALPDLIPGLISACNHDDSAMRKASIFCLVEIAMQIGDRIWDQLTNLNTGKRRLLKLYIDRQYNNPVSDESIPTR